MITCTKTENKYRIDGLTPEYLELIQDAIIHQFNVNNKKEHRKFRTMVLKLNRPIDEELEKLEKQSI